MGRLALEDVHQGENGTSQVDDEERRPGSVAQDDLCVFRESEVEDEDASLDCH